MIEAKKIKTAILVFLILLIVLQIANPGFLGNILNKGMSWNNNGIAGNIKAEQNNSFQSEQPAPEVVKIVIDPGHGGKDTGTEKKHVIESEVTLDISKKLKTCLEDKSYIVELTRDSDMSLYTLSNIKDTMQRRELDARTSIINKSEANIFVSIHVNSYPKYPNMSGSIVYYNPLVPESKALANSIQKQLNSIDITSFNRDSHNTQEADFYLLKNADIPGVLVETAFITNTNDRKLLTQDDFRIKIAQAVANGIGNYINR